MLIARLIGSAGLFERKLGPAHAGRAALFALACPGCSAAHTDTGQPEPRRGRLMGDWTP
jgi:hypothetical protein